MNKAQKTVLKSKLDAEKELVDNLTSLYEKAQKQVQKRLYELSERKDMENIQTIIHQQKYQQMLLKNINQALKGLKENQFQSVDEYLNNSYRLGYIGNMYDLMHQGIPITVPINPDKVKYAIETDSKLSKNLWDSLSSGVDTMKKKVQQEITLGILKGDSWGEIAHRMESGITTTQMVSGFNYTMRIARTEGHRIQEVATHDAMIVAKEKGADIVKQWCSTLDDRTRPSHALLDGQIREIDKPFEVNGHKGLYPGGFGVASEDIYCRCTTLQRAKWGLDKDELDTLKRRADYFHLDKSDSFKEFQKKYLKLPVDADTMKIEKVLSKPVVGTDEHYKECKRIFEEAGVTYNPVKTYSSKRSEKEIISMLGGPDLTDGSCASVAFAYVGQKHGLDVLDFRGGKSLDTFASWDNLESLIQMDGITTLRGRGASSMTVGVNLLKQVEDGKEYYLCVGRHASIIRKKEGVLQYLELQDQTKNIGWHDFTSNPRDTLHGRFACSKSSNPWHAKLDFMIDLDDSTFNEDELQSLLGFINTNVDKQKKGVGGYAK